jgi:hypothetical protein
MPALTAQRKFYEWLRMEISEPVIVIRTWMKYYVSAKMEDIDVPEVHMTQNWTARSHKKDHHFINFGPVFSCDGPERCQGKGGDFLTSGFLVRKYYPTLISQKIAR